MAWWHERFKVVLAFLLVTMAPSGAWAQQAVFESYQQSDGLTNMTVKCLTQAQNGMLWICTENGLFQFDGFRIQRVSLPQAAGADIRDAQADRLGRLWVATYEGLYFAPAQAGALQWMPVQGPGNTNLYIEGGQRIDLDAQGNLYAMDSYNHLWTVSASQPLVAQRLQLPSYEPFLGSTDGNSAYFSGPLRYAGDALWFGCGAGLCEWRGGQLHQWGPGQGLPARIWGNIVLGRDGSLWTRSSDRLARLRPGASRFESTEGPLAGKWLGGVALVEDAQGAILTASAAGIARWDGKRWQEWSHQDGVPETAVRALQFSADGSLWFGTSGRGLHHWVGYGAVDQWTTASGLPSPVVQSFARDGSGRLWVATARGMAWFDPQRRQFHPMVGAPNSNASVAYLATDAAGDLWWVQEGRVLSLRAGDTSARLAFLDKSLEKTLQGGDHVVYLVSHSGLDRLVTSRTGWRREPLLRHFAGSIIDVLTDGERDWFLTGELTRLDKNTLVPIRDQRGVPLNGPYATAAVGPNQFWIEDSTGLVNYVVQGNVAKSIRKFDAATFNGAKGNFLKAEPNGRLWYGTGQGLFIYDHERWQLLDRGNGLLWNDIDGYAFMLDADGTAWIGTSAGITQLHPGWVAPAPPNLRLDELQLGQQVMSEAPRAPVPWADRRLRVTVGTPDIGRTRSLRVEYRLDGVGPWRAMDGHVLQIESLEAGANLIEMRAVGNGAPEQAGAPLRIAFQVAPPWWLSTPAWCAYGVALLSLLAASNMLVSRRALARQRKLEQAITERTAELTASRAALRKLGQHNVRALEDERTRVARELHDEMGQQLAALRMEASVLQAHARSGTPLLPEQFKLLFDRFNLLVGSVRSLVKQLRPPALDGGLVAAIEWLAAEFTAATGVPCHLDLDPAAHALAQDRAIMVFRIVQESLTNVRRHAQAARVEIHLRLEANDGCTLTVSDDGVGFDPGRQRSGHGLLGMEERAHLLGGEITISRKPEGGTTVCFHVDEQTRRRNLLGAGLSATP